MGGTLRAPSGHGAQEGGWGGYTQGMGGSRGRGAGGKVAFGQHGVLPGVRQEPRQALNVIMQIKLITVVH